jgi:pimeloyl-ACP methyl ester carboxylesterase
MEELMERFFKLSAFVLSVLFIVGAISVTGCSSDDNPADPNPVDTTGNNDTNKTTIDDKVRPVVFVHGKFEAADLYTQMTQLFARNGYNAAQLIAFDFRSYFTGTEADVQKMATQLAAHIDAALAQSGETRVDIVAHGIGAEAVQHYLVNMQGTDKIAHVVFTGASLDMALTVAGDITPAPCKYMTVRSDGKDDLQNGNSGYGELTGATNEIAAGLDNIQLATDPAVFAKIYRFFTGTAAAETTLLSPVPGLTYNISGRVIEMIDNEPVAGVYVTPIPIRTLANGEIQRQIGGSPVETDANGQFSMDLNLSPDTHYEFRIQSISGGHFDMHIYVQAFRDDVQTLRLRMVPKATSGSQMLSQFSAAMRTGDHSNFFVHTLNEAMQASADNLVLARFDAAGDPVGEVSVLTAGNAPDAGASATGGNTFLMALLDYDQNQQDGTGPIQTPGLNMYGINSFDAYMAGKPANQQTRVTFKGRTIGVQNFASNGGIGASNGGFTMVQFEY